MQLDDSEYEMGHTKIFMRESQKQKLDNHLHTTILSRIIAIQRWYRSIRQRQHFLTLRAAVIRIQVSFINRFSILLKFLYIFYYGSFAWQLKFCI